MCRRVYNIVYYTSIKLNQRKRTKDQKKDMCLDEYTPKVNHHYLQGVGRGGKTITCYLTCTQLPSLNVFQHACITYELKKKSNTFFAPNLSPALRRPVSHAPSGPSCSAKQRHLLELSQGFLGQIPIWRQWKMLSLRTGTLFTPYIYIPDWGPHGMIAQEDNGVINLCPRLSSRSQLPIWVIKPAGSLVSVSTASAGQRERVPLEATLDFSRGASSWMTLGQANWTKAGVLGLDLAKARTQANMDLLACQGFGNSCLSFCICDVAHVCASTFPNLTLNTGSTECHRSGLPHS